MMVFALDTACFFNLDLLIIGGHIYFMQFGQLLCI